MIDYSAVKLEEKPSENPSNLPWEVKDTSKKPNNKPSLPKKTQSPPQKKKEGAGEAKQHRTEPALFPTMTTVSHQMKQEVFSK